MKLSQTLYKHNLIRWFKNKWVIQGNRRIVESPGQLLINQLKEKGLDVSEANIVGDPAPILPIVPIPAPWTPLPARDNTNPRWKTKICHSYDVHTNLLEGHLQGQILTKTVLFEGLPKRILDLVGVLDRPDQDQLVERAILLSHIWDGWQVKLPKVLDLKRPGHNAARSYGIPDARSIILLVRNLVKLLESQTGDYDALNRTHLTNTKAVFTTLKDEDLIKFNMNAILLVSSKSALEAFASPDEVSWTINATLPDMYPIKCTIDIPKRNIYEIQNFSPLSKSSVHPHLHTIYIGQKEQPPHFTKSQALNRALVTCFTFAMVRAKTLYGDSATTLPQPVTVQCVQCSKNDVSLLTYQLNTLDMNSCDGGVKNMAWVEAGIKFYDRCEDVEGKVVFQGYNPRAYSHLLAFHLNGLSNRERVALPTIEPPPVHAKQRATVN